MASSLRAGLIGAFTVTALHQLARSRVPSKAPRMDTLGRRVIVRGMLDAGLKPPEGNALQALAFAGDLATNSLFFALVGKRLPLLRGVGLGLLAGWGAVALPPVMGLGRWPSRRTRATKRMAFAMYFAGGVAAGLVARRARRREKLAAAPAVRGAFGQAPALA